MTISVALLMFDDVEELDAIGPYEVFGVAAAERPGSFAPFLVAASRDRPVCCVHRLSVNVDHDFASAPPIDLLLIPGGSGSRRAATDPVLIDWVRRTAASCRLVASICTGSRITLAAGLATGRRITTHWSAIDDARADGRAAAVLDDVRFVQDGSIIHSAGISAGIDMSLRLVADLADADLAERVRHEMDYHPGHQKIEN